MTEQINHPLTCGHAEAIASAENLGRIMTVCGTCGKVACDDCGDEWNVCKCCGGGICAECTPNAVSRQVSDTVTEWSPYRKTIHTRTERLCGPCGTRQAEARKALIADLLEAADESVWLEEIVYDVESAIKRAKKDGDL